MVEHVPAVVCQGPCFGAHHLVIIDVFVYERETIVLYEITCPLKMCFASRLQIEMISDT